MFRRPPPPVVRSREAGRHRSGVAPAVRPAPGPAIRKQPDQLHASYNFHHFRPGVLSTTAAKTDVVVADVQDRKYYANGIAQTSVATGKRSAVFPTFWTAQNSYSLCVYDSRRRTNQNRLVKSLLGRVKTRTLLSAYPAMSVIINEFNLKILPVFTVFFFQSLENL